MSSSLHQDQLLWNRWRAGDDLAGSELLARYEAALHGAIWSLGIKNLADAQDVYGNLILTLVQYKQTNHLHSSFFGLARSILLPLVRQQRRAYHRVASNRDLERATTPVAPCDQTVEFFDALSHCIQAVLKPIEREVFQDRFLRDMDNGTIARKHGKTKNHIAVILHGALEKVRSGLLEQGFGA